MHTISYMKLRIVLLAACAAGGLAAPRATEAAFSLSSTTDAYTVDTGAGLVFKVRRTDNGSSTQSPGDIMSLVYNGIEYQNQSRGSHINSGFDWLGCCVLVTGLPRHRPGIAPPADRHSQRAQHAV